MNLKFFKQSITIYQEDGTRFNYNEAYFRHNKKTNLIDKGLEKGSAGTILIPTKEDINIRTGDIVIEGNISESFEIRSFSKKYQIFKVISVDDNRKGTLQHYKIGVSE